jgi:hypothetical protein
MVGATVVFLGSASLLLLPEGEHSSTHASEAAGSPSVAAAKRGADPELPSGPKAATPGKSTSHRSGESI